MTWAVIAEKLPGRNFLSCRLRNRKYLEKRVDWDGKTKNKFARLYAQYVPLDDSGCPNCFILVVRPLFEAHICQQLLPHSYATIFRPICAETILTPISNPKDQMWEKIAKDMGISSQSTALIHWQLGEREINTHAHARVSQLHPSTMGTGMGLPSQAPVRLTFVPHGLPPANAPQSMPNPPPMPPQLYQVPPPMFSIRMHNYG